MKHRLENSRPEYSRPVSNSVKTLIFVMIGAVLIVFTDLVILDGKRYLKNLFGTEETPAERLIETTETGDLSIDSLNLKKQHARYLEKGIPIVNKKTVSQVAALPPDFTEPKSLNQIRPAVGREAEVNLSRETKEKIIETLITSKATDKTISEIIAELNPETKLDKKPADKNTVKTLERVQKLDSDTSYVQKLEFETPEREAYGKIAIIIDDMGVSARSKQLETMRGPLTLSYLPYANNLQERTRRARQYGHELMVHMPMEAVDRSLDGGPRVLRDNLSPQEFDETLRWGLSQFRGYVGLNNHMGSRLTQDKKSLQRVMSMLKEQNLYFIDSKTISSSIAAQVAREEGVAHAERDVFLDHEISPDFIKRALKRLENIARRQGHAIAIGHPHKETINALNAWIPTLEDKGLKLVPASEVINKPVETAPHIAAR